MIDKQIKGEIFISSPQSTSRRDYYLSLIPDCWFEAIMLDEENITILIIWSVGKYIVASSICDLNDKLVPFKFLTEKSKKLVRKIMRRKTKIGKYGR